MRLGPRESSHDFLGPPLFPSPFWLPSLWIFLSTSILSLGLPSPNLEFLGDKGNVLSSHLATLAFGYLSAFALFGYRCLATVSSGVLGKSSFSAGCGRLDERRTRVLCGVAGRFTQQTCPKECGVHWVSSGHCSPSVSVEMSSAWTGIKAAWKAAEGPSVVGY